MCTILAFFGRSSWGWWSNGHGILTRAAIRGLPSEIPEFLRAGERFVAHCALDPDISKNRSASQIYGAEHPEHYLDLELLEGQPLPQNRYKFTQLCHELGVRPETVGFLPYALAEWTERLAISFAEHRKWPDNTFIHNKCLVYAGFVAHYAQDLCQPLHLTIHFNGRLEADNTVRHRGIHEKVDALIEFLEMKPADLLPIHNVEPLDNLMEDILTTLTSGHGLVDKVYELAERLPASDNNNWIPAPEVIDFAKERALESVRFTASLYITAWKASKEIQLENWLNRAKLDE